MAKNIPTLTSAELRNFGLVAGAMIAGIFGFLLPWLYQFNFLVLPLYLAAGLSLWALFIPKTLQPFYRVWMRFADLLGWINTRIILGIMFYFIILPMGLLMRLVGNDPMRRRRNKKLSTYRVQSARRSTDHLEKPY